jgi:hypothetical protein
MLTDRRADMTKLIVTFRNFAKAPKMHYNIRTVREVWDSRGSIRIMVPCLVVDGYICLLHISCLQL